MGLQIPYRLCAKIPAANNIWEDKGGHRKNPARTVRKERHRNNRSDIMQRPCAYAGQDTAEVQRVGNNGISERQKLADDIRPACESEIQVQQPAYLVQGVLRGHRGQKCEKNRGIHKKPTAGRFDGRPVKPKRVHRPVYG